MDFYAWAPITVPDPVTEGKFVMIKVGERVSKSNIGDADWKPLIAAGVLRTKKYPSDIKTGESPRNAMLRKANEAMKEAQEAFISELDDDEPAS